MILEPKYKLSNRKQKRQEDRESDYVESFLCPIIDKTITMIFNEELQQNNHITYNHIYVYMLNKWNDGVEKILNNKKLKYIKINRGEFVKLFKPVEC